MLQAGKCGAQLLYTVCSVLYQPHSVSVVYASTSDIFSFPVWFSKAEHVCVARSDEPLSWQETHSIPFRSLNNLSQCPLQLRSLYGYSCIVIADASSCFHLWKVDIRGLSYPTWITCTRVSWAISFSDGSLNPAADESGLCGSFGIFMEGFSFDSFFLYW